MAWVRQLDSGLWAATVHTPTGRITETDALKGVVTAWAADREGEVRRGDWIDPRSGKLTVGKLRDRLEGGRRLEKASKKRDASHYRVHVEPKWSKVPIGSILKADINRWVVEMEEDGVGPATIEGAVGVLRLLLEQAVDSGLIRTNPCRKISTPPRDAHVDRILAADEEEQLLARLDEAFPGRTDARLFVETILDTGMRWEEAAALPPEMLDTRRQRIHIAWVLERDGTARPYAKTEAGNRAVTYSDDLGRRLAATKLAARECPGVFVPRRNEAVPSRLIFTGPGGGVMRYPNWRSRVWLPALLQEMPTAPVQRVPGRRGPLPKAVRQEPYLDDPQPTGHDLRHTFASRMAEAGMPIHELMELLGHDDLRSVQRYLHATDARFERARQALNLARGHATRSGS